MKRNEINRRIREAEAFFDRHRFHLPPFSRWSPADWRKKGDEAAEIRSCRLGWDLTDFGKDRYDELGLLLFTIRNGDPSDPDHPKCYAEKIMIVGEGQVTPWHFHWTKMEDIINRGGGELVVELAWATEDEADLDRERPVDILCDGLKHRISAGGSVVLGSGESVSLPPMLYHSFYGKPGGGAVLTGEVSRTNDDVSDNRFLEPLGRFPEIENDAEAYRLLCSEYPAGMPVARDTAASVRSIGRMNPSSRISPG